MTEDALDRAVSHHMRSDMAYGLKIHAAVFVAVNVFLAVIWALTSDGFRTMPWFLFPLGGWGIGLVAHYAVVRLRPRAV